MYLETWGKELAEKIKPLPYENILNAQYLHAGTYIFADIDCLFPTQAEKATFIWESLSKANKEIRLFNHPTRSMRRYELLRNLYERGLNRFNVYRITEARMPRHFPVFLRGDDDDHHGSHTLLLHTVEELITAINEIFRKGKSRENILIMEFCDISDKKGVFRKYSAFMVDDRIIPWHLVFSKNWMLKSIVSKNWMLKLPDMHSKKLFKEELNYLKNNPHEDQLREIFQFARIDYGRIDYGLLNGEIQVWEINTNPVVMFHPEWYNPGHIPAQEYFSRQIKPAFEAIDSIADPDKRIKISIKKNV